LTDFPFVTSFYVHLIECCCINQHDNCINLFHILSYASVLYFLGKSTENTSGGSSYSSPCCTTSVGEDPWEDARSW